MEMKWRESQRDRWKSRIHPGSSRFSFDRSVHNDVTLHLIEIDIPAYEEEAQAVFGETFEIHIGTGEKAVYLAFGNESEKLLMDFIDTAGSDSSSNRPVGQLQFSLLTTTAIRTKLQLRGHHHGND